ncbi:MAG: ferredoxin family protein [Tannerellaceae bacterium]
MQYKSLHLIYFSPTHSSAKIAYAIAEGLGISTFSESDITLDVEDDQMKIEDELTIVAVPVYGGRVAETAMQRLRSFHARQTPVIPVVVYGNRDYEDALRELCDLTIELGFVPIAAGAFIGEHSFSRPKMPIAAGRPDDADHLAAIRFGKDACTKLRGVACLDKMTPLVVKGNFPYKVKSPSTPQAPVIDEDLCTRCDCCMDVCPTGAITITEKEGQMVSDPLLCIKCCACVKECPEGARSFDTPYTALLSKNFSARREPELFF